MNIQTQGGENRTPESWESLLQRVKQGLPVRTDSRTVESGDVFVAMPGAACDGAAFIPQALERGAAFVVCGKGTHLPAGVTAQAFEQSDPRQALGELAAARFGTAVLSFPLAGVTGTNGKTTITYLLEHIISHSGGRGGVIGTVEYRWPGHSEIASHTTPDCLRLHALLADMAKAGVTGAVMEVSSHALDQHRVAGLAFDVAALTNVTQDHLDYHGQMETYFQAKRRFFTECLRDPSKAAINADDAYGRRLLAEFPQALGYGLIDGPANSPVASGAPGRMLTGRILSSTGQGLEMEMTFQGDTWRITSPLVGSFNAANLLTTQAMALCLGFQPEALHCLATCLGAPGRLERVANTQGRTIFVDYAHTPDAMENVLKALKSLDFKRILAVFGCGGNRDKAKRPLMAQAVAKWADVAVLTSDNPRHEDPQAIIEDARPGLSGAAKVIVDADRRRAISQALAEMQSGDVLIVAGKGHEDYQQIGDVKYPFNDVVVVKELLQCA